MAIINTEGMVSSLSFQDELPRNRYTVRMISETFAPSKQSNPMVTREWEIVDPEKVIINGKEKLVSGIKLLQYLPIEVFEDGELNKKKTADAQVRFVEENRKLNLPSEGIDDKAPLAGGSGIGIVADAILSSEKISPRQSLTPEQRAKGDKVGSPIKDANGKDIISYRPKLDSIYGLSDFVPANPY